MAAQTQYVNLIPDQHDGYICRFILQLDESTQPSCAFSAKYCCACQCLCAWRSALFGLSPLKVEQSQMKKCSAQEARTDVSLKPLLRPT